MEDSKFRFDCKTNRFVNRVSGEEIPDDEPVMIFRARDVHALLMVQVYQMRVKDAHHKQAVQDVVDAFERFQKEHPERMKEPGITHHVKLEGE